LVVGEDSNAFILICLSIICCTFKHLAIAFVNSLPSVHAKGKSKKEVQERYRMAARAIAKEVKRYFSAVGLS
jgi:hypothetical protein